MRSIYIIYEDFLTKRIHLGNWKYYYPFIVSKSLISSGIPIIIAIGVINLPENRFTWKNHCKGLSSGNSFVKSV